LGQSRASAVLLSSARIAERAVGLSV
jgi:hypothetical protein